MANEMPDEVAGQPEKENTPRIPAPDRWDDAIEAMIDEAMRAGAFDNLPGHGKPLKLNQNPYAPGTELAYQLLKDNNYTLPWISDRQTTLGDIEALREDIHHSWQRYRAEYVAGTSEQAREDLLTSWHERQERWVERIRQLNERIGDLNLRQPGSNFEVLKLSLEGELIRAGANHDLTSPSDS